MRVEYSRDARELMAAIDDRWSAEHGFADNPLWEKLEATLARLADYPNSGELAGRSWRGVVVRRRLFARESWHVYYTYDEDRALLVVLAVWYAGRGSRPAF